MSSDSAKYSNPPSKSVDDDDNSLLIVSGPVEISTNSVLLTASVSVAPEMSEQHPILEHWRMILITIPSIVTRITLFPLMR